MFGGYDCDDAVVAAAAVDATTLLLSTRTRANVDSFHNQASECCLVALELSDLTCLVHNCDLSRSTRPVRFRFHCGRYQLVGDSGTGVARGVVAAAAAVAIAGAVVDVDADADVDVVDAVADANADCVGPVGVCYVAEVSLLSAMLGLLWAQSTLAEESACSTDLVARSAATLWKRATGARVRWM